MHGLRWTPKTGPEFKIEKTWNRKAIDGEEAEDSFGDFQGESGVSGGEGVGDGERVGVTSRCSSDAGPSVEETAVGRSRGDFW